MTPPTASSGDTVAKLFSTGTAITLAAILFYGGETMLPSGQHHLKSPVLSGHSWEENGTFTGKRNVPVNEIEIMKEFVSKIVYQSKDLDPRYYQIIMEDFWDLV
jgi:hypothetical protein